VTKFLGTCLVVFSLQAILAISQLGRNDPWPRTSVRQAYGVAGDLLVYAALAAWAAYPIFLAPR
jgi:hypothetical protein